MKLRLTQPGFQTYTGQMGVVQFVNGVSVNDVLPIDGIRISAAIGAEWEDGTASNVGQMYLNAQDAPAFVGGGVNDLQIQPAPVVKEVAPQAQPRYTEAVLAKIADDEGIQGLRKIGEELGVKGTSIVGLIEGILKAQGKNKTE